MIREDLLALTPDSLAALANRGLVKRATKDLDAGKVPDIDLEQGGEVRATFPDGVETVLPATGGLEAATCSCSSAAKCRHRIGAVLAYQRRTDDGRPSEPADTATPAAITDEQLRETVSRRAFTAAEKTRRTGYTARLTWPGPDRPAVAELPTCTVSFLVPGELGYLHTDATGPGREVGIVLAVWAFREAEPQAETIAVGGGAAAEPDLTEAVALAERVLACGVEGVDDVLIAALAREAENLSERRLHWPAGALGDLIDQLRRYHDRAASYEPQHLAALLAELPARDRAFRAPGGTPNRQVLGADESDQTPLTLVRLTGLGCRIGTDGDRRTAELYLAHPETGMVLTVRRDWQIPQDRPLTGADLAGRRLAGRRIGELAGGNVVTEAASRTAARALRLGTGRLAKTQVLPLGRAWTELPTNLRVTDVRRLKAALETLPPAMIRPRVSAEMMRVIEVDQVQEAGYDPSAQRFRARFTAPEGGSALLRATHRSAAPGSLEAVENALTGHPTAIAGTVRRHRGEVLIEPTAILTPDGPVLPDLARGDDSADLAPASRTAEDPVAAALETALRACADLAHRGLGNAREPSVRLAETAAADLRRVGLRSTAANFTRLSEALSDEYGPATTSAWTDAAIRTLVTAELH